MALIDIGSQKQLFVDNYLIESMTNTCPILNTAEKIDNNPVLRPERPWEGSEVQLNTVVYNEMEGIFEMRYTCRTITATRRGGEVVMFGGIDPPDAPTCLAISEDGIKWERPNLGLVDYKGSKHNNIIPPDWLMGYVYKDPKATDEQQRYRGHVRAGTTSTPGMTFDLYYSPDMKTWTPYKNNPIIDTSPRVGRWGPSNFMGWDPVRKVYAVHMENSLHRRGPMGKRLIGRSESPDGLGWSDPETILIPDELDAPDTEFYAFPVITYEGIYVGMPWIFRTTNTTHHPELAFSRDGIHYERKFRTPFIGRGSKWEFDSTSIYAQAPIVHGDRIFTYYQGTNWRSPEQLLTIGDKADRAVGLAITPLDGFVSLDGIKGGPSRWHARDALSYSEMVTRSFTFSGSRLYINVEAALQHGGAEPMELRVEILEPNHEYIDGLEFSDANPVTKTGFSEICSWNGTSDLSKLQDKAIKLRFYFKNCKIYSFQFR